MAASRGFRPGRSSVRLGAATIRLPAVRGTGRLGNFTAATPASRSRCPACSSRRGAHPEGELGAPEPRGRGRVRNVPVGREPRHPELRAAVKAPEGRARRPRVARAPWGPGGAAAAPSTGRPAAEEAREGDAAPGRSVPRPRPPPIGSSPLTSPAPRRSSPAPAAPHREGQAGPRGRRGAGAQGAAVAPGPDPRRAVRPLARAPGR